jgi:hypothetical protein
MRCPTCGETTPERFWVVMGTTAEFTTRGAGFGTVYWLRAPQEPGDLVRVHWMHCANEQCQELVIRLQEGYSVTGELDDFTPLQERIVRPSGAARAVAPEVPEPYRSDYLEAADILDQSPRMSAVLSRSVLADVLEKYGGFTQRATTARIDAFANDETAPSELRKNAHFLRAMGDFSAHTITPKPDSVDSGEPDIDHAQRIVVTREEAEWTLDVLDGLFDYYIIAPARNRAMREGMSRKIEDAGRKPIDPT